MTALSSLPFATMLKPLLQLLWLVPLLVLGGVLKSAWFKGKMGEYAVKRLIRRHLNPVAYREFSDITLSSEGETTQIDHVYVSLFGIFVIETKNMRGWIYGGKHQAEWTQVIYRSKRQFQNPLRQNYKHIKTLETLLDLPFDVFKSIIVFAGDCTFKTLMPAEVRTRSDVIDYIRSINARVLTHAQVQEICEKLQTLRLKPSFRVHREHVKSLKRRHRKAQ